MAKTSITIADVAEALGVSKTTVSRAISGKGRIGEETKAKVLSYIEEHDYKPNVIAKGLAQSKTFNLCVVMPGNCDLVDLPFFQEVIAGIQEVAGLMEYDILLCLCSENDVSSLARILQNRKVDGVILLRTFLKDLQIELLLEKQVPFLATGSTAYPGVVQIDHDHVAACKELTSILLLQENHKIALLGGNEHFVVNQNRRRGFEEAYEKLGQTPDSDFYFFNLENRSQIDLAVESSLDAGCDCILCMDDAICSQVLRKLRLMGKEVPKDIRLASFYNSSVLENHIPSITSLSFSAKELGMTACRSLLDLIEKQPVQAHSLLSYEVNLRESTKA